MQAIQPTQVALPIPFLSCSDKGYCKAIGDMSGWHKLQNFYEILVCPMRGIALSELPASRFPKEIPV